MEGRQQQIIFLRTGLNLSQAAFAKEIGYSQSYVGDIESGKAKPSRRFLEAVSQRFNISIDQLTSDLGERVLRLMEQIPSHSGYGFVFMYDFTEKGLDICETEILQALGPHPIKFVDASNLTSKQLLGQLLDSPQASLEKLWTSVMYLADKYKFYIIKNLSKSKLDRKAPFLTGFAQQIGHLSSLIVIDKPSFLEKNAEHLYYHAYPFAVPGRSGGRIWH